MPIYTDVHLKEQLCWKRKMCLSNNSCHSHIKSVSHHVQLYRYHWPFWRIYKANDGFSHIFMASILFIYTQYNWLPSPYDKVLYTLGAWSSDSIHPNNIHVYTSHSIIEHENYRLCVFLLSIESLSSISFVYTKSKIKIFVFSYLK
jgi:hypothetical protein